MSAISLATDLADRGFAVFPCLSSKVPTTPRGFHDATSHPDAVRQLWRRWPGALIGMPTGPVNGFDVLDVDPRHGGDTWHDEHRDNLPATRTHTTRSGGLHVLFRHLDGVRNSAGRIAPGIDVRGEGGFVIWWPAAGCPEVARGAPAVWPTWLHAGVLRPAPKPDGRPTVPQQQTDQLGVRHRRFIEKLLANLRAATDGTKHQALLKQSRMLGGVAGACGVTDADAVGWLLAALPDGVMDWAAANRTALDGLQDGRRDPLQLEDRPWPRT